jgi:hypothetical protein
MCVANYTVTYYLQGVPKNNHRLFLYINTVSCFFSTKTGPYLRIYIDIARSIARSTLLEDFPR